MNFYEYCLELNERVDARKKNVRPNVKRFSVSLPAEMDPIIDAISAQCDLEYAKIFRSALDEFVRLNRDKLNPATWDEYWSARRRER